MHCVCEFECCEHVQFTKAYSVIQATTEKKRPRLSGNRTLDELFPKAGEQASNKVESENVRDSADLDLTWSQ